LQHQNNNIFARMDFTLKTYRKLLLAFSRAEYGFITFEEFCRKSLQNSTATSHEEAPQKFVILRHDVDLRAENALAIAKTEHSLGIRASYYFRAVPQSNKPEIITQIVDLQHEIGYHYEDLALAKGNTAAAMQHFEEKLAYFRRFYPVTTICMHGSPTSKYDNRTVWKTNDYRQYGIIGEPYFDVDFNRVFYLTDTGRCWDGEKFSVRDKVKSAFNLHCKSTNDIINALKINELPSKIMITTHPQRWTDNKAAWTAELILQNIKNFIKIMIVKN